MPALIGGFGKIQKKIIYKCKNIQHYIQKLKSQN